MPNIFRSIFTHAISLVLFVLTYLLLFFFWRASISYLVILSIFLFQKYRLHLKRVKSNPSSDAYERRNSSYKMNNQGNFMHNHEYGRCCLSCSDIASRCPNNYGATGHLAQSTNIQSNFFMGSSLHGARATMYVRPQQSYARRFTSSSDSPVSLYNNIPNERMLDAFPSWQANGDKQREDPFHCKFLSFLQREPWLSGWACGCAA